MRPVHADDVVPERPWQSPKRVTTRLGILIGVWAVTILAIRVLHVPFGVLITFGVLVTAAAITVDLVRWRRQRHR
jgi:hypothetical protein